MSQTPDYKRKKKQTSTQAGDDLENQIRDMDVPGVESTSEAESQATSQAQSQTQTEADNNFDPNAINPSAFNQPTNGYNIVYYPEDLRDLEDEDLPFETPVDDHQSTSDVESDVATSAEPQSQTSVTASQSSSQASQAVSATRSKQASKARSRAVSETNDDSQLTNAQAAASVSNGPDRGSDRHDQSSASASSYPTQTKPKELISLNPTQMAKLESITQLIPEINQDVTHQHDELGVLYEEIKSSKGRLTKAQRQEFDKVFKSPYGFPEDLNKSTVLKMLDSRMKVQQHTTDRLAEINEDMTNALGNFYAAQALSGDDKNHALEKATDAYTKGYQKLEKLYSGQVKAQDKLSADRSEMLDRYGINENQLGVDQTRIVAHRKMTKKDFRDFRTITEARSNYWPVFGAIDDLQSTVNNEILDLHHPSKNYTHVSSETRAKGGQADTHIDTNTISAPSNPNIDVKQERQAPHNHAQIKTTAQKEADDAEAGQSAKDMADAISDQQLIDLNKKMEAQKKQLEKTQLQIKQELDRRKKDKLRKQQAAERKALESDKDDNGNFKTREQYQKDQQKLKALEDEINATEKEKQKPASDYAKAFNKTHEETKHISTPALVGELTYRFGARLVGFAKSAWKYVAMATVAGGMALHGKHAAKVSNPLNRAAASMHAGLVSSIDSAAGDDVANKLAQERQKVTQGLSR